MIRWLAPLSLILSLALPIPVPAQEAEPAPKPPKFSIKLHGFIKGDVIYETNGQGKITLFAPKDIPDPARTTFTVAQSRFGIGVKGPQVLNGRVDGTLELDFYGGGPEYAPTPRLYRGFVRAVWPTFHILVGTDWDTNSKLYGKTVIFFYPPVGNPQFRRFQIRAVKSFQTADRAGFVISIAAAQPPQQDLDGHGFLDGDDFGVPMIQGRVAYEQFAGGEDGKGFGYHQHQQGTPPVLVLGLSGHCGGEEVDWDEPGNGDQYETWSLTSEARIPIGKHVSATCELFTGCNLDHAYGGIVQGINPETRRAIHSSGGWGQLDLKVGKRLEFHAGAGIDKPRESDLSGGMRKQNVAAYGNAFLKLGNGLVAAVENVHYWTDYVDAGRAENNRVQFALIFKFKDE